MNLLISALLLLQLAHLSQQACTPEFTAAFVERTNVHRANHSVSNLTLDEDISSFAQEWADHLLETGTIEHRWDNTYGENIFKSWYPDGHAQPPEESVDWFYNEIRYYDYFGQEPDMSTFEKWGHFSMLVWKNHSTVGVGCAISSNNATTVIVANYWPAGNIAGQYADNVLPPKNSSTEAAKKKKSKTCTFLERWCSG